MKLPNWTNWQYNRFEKMNIIIYPKHLKNVPLMEKINNSLYRRPARAIGNASRRHWCFTLNNPSRYYASADIFMQNLVEKIATRLRYCIFQEEKGEQTSHYQGYLELNCTARMQWIKTAIGGNPHLESRFGTREQARNYCMKLETRVNGPWEHGNWRKGGSGSRNDLLEVSDMVQAGAHLLEVSRAFPVTFIKFHKGISKLISLNIEVRTVAPQIILCFGKTGTGKTKWAYDSYPKLYKKPCDTRWFDTYIGQKCLLLDDFAGAASKVSLNYTLQLLDRYPMIVEVKGDYVGLQATSIVITTNLHPKTWYNYNDRIEQFNALARRFHTVLWFHTFGEPPKPVSVEYFFQQWWDGAKDEDYLLEETEKETQELKNESPNSPVSLNMDSPIFIDLTRSSSEEEEEDDISVDLFL